MRSSFLTILIVAAAGCAQRSDAPVPIIPAPSAGIASAGPATATAIARPPAGPPAGGEVLAGTVAEKIDTPQYTYLRLQTPSGEVWAAVTKAQIAVGAPARVINPMWMQDFKSPSLGRTWAKIAFGALEGAAPAAPAQPAAEPAPMMAQAGAQPPELSGPGSPHAPASDGAPISVPRASGKGAHTIAEVFAQKGALHDQKVRVSGKVVKETDHVLGKNWIHLRDGSGKDTDLAVATDDTSAVGKTVVVAGVVHLDRDLGAGYHYDVLIEDAHVEAE